MDRKTLEAELGKLSFYSSMNQEMHRMLVERYGWWDQRTKQSLGLLACAGFAASVYAWGAGPPASGSWDVPGVIGLITGFVSLLAAVVLNISPADAMEQKHAALLARWSDLYRDISALEMLAKTMGDNDLEQIASRLPDLVQRQEHIELQDDTVLDEALRDLCEGNEYQRRWGPGFRTYEAVKAEKERRERQKKMDEEKAASAPKSP